MAYADFDYYKASFFGNAIAEEDFPAMAARASEYIDYITRGKAAGAVSEQVKKACCALAESFCAIHKAAERNAAGEIASESVGSYSVSYRSGSDVAAQMRQSMYKTAQMYLLGTGLLYRGGGACQCMHLTP